MNKFRWRKSNKNMKKHSFRIIKLHVNRKFNLNINSIVLNTGSSEQERQPVIY